MTNKEAIWELMCDHRRNSRLSKTSYKRVLKALSALSIIGDDREWLLIRMSYHAEDGKQYDFLKDTK